MSGLCYIHVTANIVDMWCVINESISYSIFPDYSLLYFTSLSLTLQFL